MWFAELARADMVEIVSACATHWTIHNGGTTAAMLCSKKIFNHVKAVTDIPWQMVFLIQH